MDADLWAEQKAKRRYRYAHLRNKKSVPMSIRMEDRHGLSNLVHERVKALDKMHFPPWLAMLLIGFPLAAIILNTMSSEEEAIHSLRERSTLLAMKRT